MRTSVKNLLNSATALDSVELAGWVRTRRDSKEFSFMELNDGSCLKGIQVIIDLGTPGSEEVGKMNTGAAVKVAGELLESPGQGQSWEVRATEVELVGGVPDDFPLQKKGHTPEFLRSIAHLRPRTNLYGATFRMRSRLAYAVHRFFNERDFTYVHTPVITTSDCEGAGEMFQVTTNDAGQAEEDFFGKKSYLTVSGQLEAETFACALSNVYTFGPTFRAENSNTSRHASEFWMIEPEMAFCNLEGDMDLAEDFIQFLVKDVLENNEGDLEIFAKFVDKGLRQRLEGLVGGGFERMSYTEAVEKLIVSGKKFDYPVQWGANLQSEHERYLCEEVVKGPLTVYNYPKSIKPFYMRANDDGKTVTAMDVLVPGVGEIIGGSQREERYDLLKAEMEENDLSLKNYGWYLDLRKYGTVPHAGFGAGFERLLMYVTGMQNIRDVIPFARTPGNCEF
ncbi:MAG: asparagine--tRNA ligase [Verrucomicrobiaceae bacterium TMED137]|nr:MAG: asparagine--tRNA ligase [Verrucomicrobiaceae bacterium TMED137]HAE20556.1 asparagine--tRNA ligase [Verrucomicrobiales bacterium]HCN81620.1 asparagine--tRNA ligase [Verrucomicrobiales bacterium]|tara:strand:+ start:212 stop:1564 length:1353 start_codon:yes stop_codon:yes gene_type:complete